MREVSDSLLPRSPDPVSSQQTTATRQDTVRADSAVVTLLDSLSQFTSRKLDSLQNANQVQLQGVVGQMRGQLREELLRQVEESRAGDRRTYVTQAEQAQMTRALLDEMDAHLEALRDSLRREHEQREALAIDIDAAVTLSSDVTYRRNEYGNTVRKRSFWHGEVTETVLGFSWAGDISEAVIEVKHQGECVLDRAYVLFTLDAADSVAQCIGVGQFDTPYGVETNELTDLLAPTQSGLVDFRIAPDAGIWFSPWCSDRTQFLLLPYRQWDEDNQAGLTMLSFTWPQFTMQFSAAGARVNDLAAQTRAVEAGENLYDDADRDVSTDESSDMIHGDISLRYDGPVWVFGLEGLFTRRNGNAPDPYTALESRTDDFGVMLLVHRRISDIWGWTLRGDLLECRTEWTGGPEPATGVPEDRIITAMTGPSFNLLDERLRLSCAYTFRYRTWRAYGSSVERTDFDHVLGASLTHTF